MSTITERNDVPTIKGLILRIWPLATLLGLAVIFSGTAFGLDHRNLDEGFPLIVEDAYPIKFREFALQAMGRYSLFENDTSEAGLPMELEYGIARNMQLSVSTEIISRTPGENEGSGNVGVDLLYNWNTETLSVPAFSLKAGVEFPSGVGDQGTEVAWMGIITKSFRFHRIHINAGYSFVVDPQGEQRDGTWKAVAGWDHPAGLHWLILADIVVKQSEYRSNSAVTLLEFGLRRQLTPRWIFNGGLGTGLSGNTERPNFFLTAGISRSF